MGERIGDQAPLSPTRPETMVAIEGLTCYENPSRGGRSAGRDAS